MSHDQKSSNVFGVAVVAGAIGAVAGLLLAPKRGEETRAELRAKYAEMKQKSVDGAETAKNKFHDGVETAKGKVHDLTDKTRSKVNDAADKADSFADKTANQAHDKAEEASRKARTPRAY